MSGFRSAFLGLFACTLSMPTGFALNWETRIVKIDTVPFQSTQEIKFLFTNDSDKAVAILDLQTTCDCLSVRADKNLYAPGEKGAIHGIFTIGDRIGLYERTITVLTDQDETPAHLTLRVEVPALAAVKPLSVTWDQTEPAAEKIIVIQPAEGLDIRFDEVQLTNSNFTATLETITAGKLYRLHVLPQQTGHPANAAIRIKGREKSGRDVIVSAYANVHSLAHR